MLDFHTEGNHPAVDLVSFAVEVHASGTHNQGKALESLQFFIIGLAQHFGALTVNDPSDIAKIVRLELAFLVYVLLFGTPFEQVVGGHLEILEQSAIRVFVALQNIIAYQHVFVVDG